MIAKKKTENFNYLLILSCIIHISQVLDYAHGKLINTHTYTLALRMLCTPTKLSLPLSMGALSICVSAYGN